MLDRLGTPPVVEQFTLDFETGMFVYNMYFLITSLYITYATECEWYVTNYIGEVNATSNN